MATVTRTVNFSCNIRLDVNGNFMSASRVPTNQCMVDGTKFCEEQQPSVPVSLAELKAWVAALT